MYILTLGFWFALAFGIEIHTEDDGGHQTMLFFGPFVVSLGYHPQETYEED